MTITAQTRVADILTARPDLRWTLVTGGITGLADENHHPSPGVTVAIAAGRHGADEAALVIALNQAIQEKPDMKLIRAIKKKIAEHQHGCCHCGGTPTNTPSQRQANPIQPDERAPRPVVTGRKRA